MDEKLKVYDDKMTKTINNLESELAAIRAGRANPHVLDKLTVDYYGVPTPSRLFRILVTLPLLFFLEKRFTKKN